MTDYSHGYDNQSDDDLLAKCKKGWRSSETPCGTGSEKANSVWALAALRDVWMRYNIETMNDAGAGDLNWLGDEALVGSEIPSKLSYRAFDLVPRHRLVTELDITKEIMPQADLILCRHVLNHLSIEKAMFALSNFKQSGSRYLLMTNCDNQAGYWQHYYFRPFSRPLQVYDDCQHWWLELHDLRESLL